MSSALRCEFDPRYAESVDKYVCKAINASDDRAKGATGPTRVTHDFELMGWCRHDQNDKDDQVS